MFFFFDTLYLGKKKSRCRLILAFKTALGSKKMKKGFTLVELLVVVLIIGILAAVAVPQYAKAARKARWALLWPQLNALVTAQDAHYMANGAYASSLDDLDIQFQLDSEKYIYLTGHLSNGEWSVYVGFRSGPDRGLGLLRFWKEYYGREVVLGAANISAQKVVGWRSTQRERCKKYGGTMAGTSPNGWCVFK